RYITPNVPSSERGTATLGMIVVVTLRRNRNTTRMTSAMEMTNVISTSATDARMVVVRSIKTDTSTAGEIQERIWGSRASTRSAVSMMLAPGCRKMITNT